MDGSARFQRIEKEKPAWQGLVREGKVEELDMLIASDKSTLLSVDENKRTVFAFSCEIGALEIVRLLLKKYMRIPLVEGDIAIAKAYAPTTVVHVATQNKNEKVLAALLEAGAPLIRDGDYEGNTPLMYASSGGFVKGVRLLLKAGSPIDEKTKNSKQTALYKASSAGQLECVRALIEAKADLNLASQVNETPVYAACQNGNVEVLRALLQAGADPNIARDQGFSPIYIACHRANFECTRLMVSYKADLEIRNHRQQTAIYAAAWKGCVESTRALVEGGCDVNIQGYDGATPLMIAMQNGFEECAKIMLKGSEKWGARTKSDPNIGMLDGFTALHCCALRGRLRCAILAIRHGAKENARTKDGRSALDVAKKHRSSYEMGEQVVRLLSKDEASLYQLCCRTIVIHDLESSGLPPETRKFLKDGYAYVPPSGRKE